MAVNELPKCLLANFKKIKQIPDFGAEKIVKNKIILL
jgi:hypothetical protein